MREGRFYPDFGLERIVAYHERQDARFAEAADELITRPASRSSSPPNWRSPIRTTPDRPRCARSAGSAIRVASGRHARSVISCVTPRSGGRANVVTRRPARLRHDDAEEGPVRSSCSCCSSSCRRSCCSRHTTGRRRRSSRSSRHRSPLRGRAGAVAHVADVHDASAVDGRVAEPGDRRLQDGGHRVPAGDRRPVVCGGLGRR